MEIDRFVWTEHALMRLAQRGLDAADVEEAIRTGHAEREVNDGRAEWLVSCELTDGTTFEAIYDHPHGGDDTAVRIVSGLEARFLADWRRYPLRTMFAYYDRDADIAWFPTGESTDVVSERVPGGLRDYDRSSHQLVAIEVWDASTRLPASILDALPAPAAAQGAAA
jgi:uncharacterized protein YuzE